MQSDEKTPEEIRSEYEEMRLLMRAAFPDYEEISVATLAMVDQTCAEWGDHWTQRQLGTFTMWGVLLAMIEKGYIDMDEEVLSLALVTALDAGR